jgi:hypothetical protein
VPLVHHETPSGLVVATQASDETSVRRALKQFDDRLMLDKMIDPDWGRIVWQVLCRVAADQPPRVVFRWRGPDGEPLPLSHGLVEQAKRLHVASRAPREDPAAANDRLRARHEEAAGEEIEFYAAELVERVKGKKSHLLPRGLHRRNRMFPNVTGIG